MDVKYLFPLFWLAMSGGLTIDETGKVFRFFEKNTYKIRVVSCNLQPVVVINQLF